ncbi:rubredoxin [Candidatus Woesearchaeota archaeon]|nr:rubredoxin [Candidatus Woesearchaeota archaeon]
MTKYKCDVCNVFEYDTEKGDDKTGMKAGTKPADFPEKWRCPICQADKTHLIEQTDEVSTPKKEPEKKT